MYRVLLDMDEVLCDFIGGACRVWGKSEHAVLEHWPKGEWDIIPPVSRALGRSDPLMSRYEFFGRLNREPLFWHSLLPLPWMRRLVNLAETLAVDWHVISSPVNSPQCYAGKVHWLKKMFGEEFDRFALTPHKEIFARPKTILIDDRDETVEKFRQAGGIGIVFPRHHNSLHLHQHDPMEYVGNQLYDLISKTEV